MVHANFVQKQGYQFRRYGAECLQKTLLTAHTFFFWHHLNKIIQYFSVTHLPAFNVYEEPVLVPPP